MTDLRTRRNPSVFETSALDQDPAKTTARVEESKQDLLYLRCLASDLHPSESANAFADTPVDPSRPPPLWHSRPRAVHLHQTQFFKLFRTHFPKLSTTP
jgi:hypothetical protein